MKKWIVGYIVLFIVLAGACVVLAQEKPAPPKPAAAAPQLSEVDGLKIENALLKVNAAKANLDVLNASFQALLTSLQKPGYQIGQGADGKLAYVKAEPEVKK